MSANLTNIPTYVTNVPQEFFIEPLNSPTASGYHLDSFPDALYNKAPSSILVKLLYTILGPVGMGFVQDAYVKNRLALEDSGIEGFNLDGFYGDPFKFPRVLNESYVDVGSLATLPGWDEIKAKDASYRTRAINFVKGAHMGGTVNGLTLVAQSGLDKNVDLVERYKIFFDRRSEFPLDLEDIGATKSLNELVVRPIITEEDYAVGTDNNQFEYDRHSADAALSRIKPVDVFVTIDPYSAGGRVNHWTTSHASSSLAQVAQFVTGSNSIPWPAADNTNWIQASKEVQAPQTGVIHNYEFFHKIKNINPSSTHVGPFSSEQSGIFPVFRDFTSDTEVFSATRALAKPSSMFRSTDVVTVGVDRPQTIFNHIYPDSYLNFLDSSPANNEFWASAEDNVAVEEYLVLDLGVAKAVNFISFESLNLPVSIDIEFDVADLDPVYNGAGGVTNTVFVPAIQIGPINALRLDSQRASIWEHVTLQLSDQSNNTIFTRFVKIKLVRRSGLSTPWSIPIRGVQVGRIS